MAPKKASETKAEGSKSKSASGHSYQEMITDAIIALKERNGSSRLKLKKYVQANYNVGKNESVFDANFKRALRSGVEKGIFTQPKGPSGGTKLAKKAAKPAAVATPKKVAARKTETKESGSESDESASKEGVPKKTPAKKATAKKATPKKSAVKKDAVKKASPKATPKAAPKKKATPKKADAVEDKPTVLTKTKSGRVTKTTAKPVASKKVAPKKIAAKKDKTPKKAEAAA